MNEIYQHLWYKQISYQKKKGLISNGLTIPFLIGTYELCCSYLVRQQNPIKFLFDEIINSEIGFCAVLQKCPNINQFVIGIEDREFCEKHFKREICFKNAKDNKILIITQNASELGSDLMKIVDALNVLYIENIDLGKCSWNSKDRIWQEFNEKDKKIILSAKESEI